MRKASFLMAFAAAANVSLQAPLVAFAGQGVQPVPYNPSQPVQGTAAPLQPLPPAPPPPPPTGAVGGNDVIVLKGGGMLRGRIIEIIPNDHATIALATGQNAIVEWGRIDRIEQQPSAPPPPPPGGGMVMVVPPPPGSLAPMGPAGKVWVHIESGHDLVLEGRAPSGSWAPVCNSPCDAEVPLAYSYRITGSGVRPTHDFMIEGAPGQHVVLNVKAASKAGFTGGIVLVSVSPALILIGLLVVLVGAAENATVDCGLGTTTGDSCNTNSNAGSGTETTGWIMTLIGVGGTVAGIVLVATNARTSFSEDVIRPGAPAASLPQPRYDAWLRTPTWHDASGERGLPHAQLSPIFSHAF